MHIPIKKAFICSLSSLAILTLAACDSSSKVSGGVKDGHEKPELIIAGSTFAQPFFNKALETYGANHPDRKLTYRSVGSGAGIDQFIEAKADIGTTDAPISQAEAASVKGGVG